MRFIKYIISVAIYTLLSNVARNFFSRFGFWAEGLGVNAQNSKLLIIVLIFLFPSQYLL